MSNDKPLVSICIPTFKRIDLTRKTIESIYSDSKDEDITNFEVIVSDNDSEESSRVFESEFKYENFHYYPTKCEGFLNSYYVLSYGKGSFLKLQNNVDMFKKGTLAYLIKQINVFKDKEPIIFHSNGMLNNFSVSEYNDINGFMQDLNYFCSWSAGFGIWKEDFDKIKDKVKINKWFPQTSLLLNACAGKKCFLIDDNILRESQPIHKKGGYNTYEVFGESFLDLLNDAVNDNLISVTTFESIRKILFKKYIASRYLKTVILKRDSFDHSHIQEHLKKYYGKLAMIRLFCDALIYPIRYAMPREYKLRKNLHSSISNRNQD